MAQDSESLVLVLGAGASKEVDLPVGDELKVHISAALNFKIEDGREVRGGTRAVAEALYKIAQNRETSQGNVSSYLRVAAHIAEAMPLAPSIDNFIDCQRDDPKVAQVGKLAIASCILSAERKSSIYVDRGNSYNRVDFKKASSTWFNSFFQILTEDCPPGHLHERFSQVTIVSFNYDRCVRHYLRESLLSYYHLEPSRASEIAARLRIFHPYGSIGPLRFEDHRGIDYGEEFDSEQVINAASRLKTFTEGTNEDSSEILAIRTVMRKAQRVVFLGFAFHPLNLDLLFGRSGTASKNLEQRVFGSAYRISDSNTLQIVAELSAQGGYSTKRMSLRNALTARGLLDEYSRSLSLRAARAA